MSSRGFLAFFLALSLGFSAPAAKAERPYVELLIQYYADYYDVPLELVRRVVQRESTFNPRARNGPYWGLMQIRHDTAQTMGYRGPAEGLLDAETNLIYAVRYLRGAYIVAGGNHDRAVRHYAAGYYYHARDKGLLEVAGLRSGPNNPPLAPQPGRAAPQPAPPPVAAQSPEPVVVAAAVAPDPVPAPPSAPARPVVAALGFAPPPRPSDLGTPASESPAIAAIAIQTEGEAAAPTPEPGPQTLYAALARDIESASASAARRAASGEEHTDLLRGAFSVFDIFGTPTDTSDESGEPAAFAEADGG